MSAPMPYRLIHVGGLPVNVFSTVDLSVITAKVAVLYAEALQPMVESILNHDQRNHGHRIADIKSLGAWTEGNMNHAVDMYAMFDVSFLIDFLPRIYFPLVKHKARLSMGIPIIGCPNYTHLIKARAEASGVAFVPPTYLQATDAAASESVRGKKILVLS
ncbi:hypothetical protein BC835DRAFT_1374550, partial [Cytidiella melzeri]